MKTITALILVFGVAATSFTLVARAGDPGKDWPMWGGTPDRNMVSNHKGLPTSWDVKTNKNVAWVEANWADADRFMDALRQRIAAARGGRP